MNTFTCQFALLLCSVLALQQVERLDAFVIPTKTAASTNIHLSYANQRTSASQRSITQQLHVQNNNDNDDPELAKERNKQRTCVKQFLTQRSIQSFMFLCEQVRDPHTGDWVERLLGSSDLLNFHGTGAFDLTRFPTWDYFFRELIQQPKQIITIQAKRRGRGHGGWSKNNPYMKDRYVEYEIDIVPENILPRIMSVREQIGNEFVEDIDVVRVANDQILDSYHERKKNVDGTSTKAFDRNTNMMLNNNMAMDVVRDKVQSSPFRKGSLDLLQLLSLQEAIHCMLREYMAQGESKEVSFQFLRDFYVQRTGSFFDGYVNYGRADDFLEELLLTTPSVRTSDTFMELIDPLSIATDIISMRSTVLIDWKEEMFKVPQDHIELRKILLSKQMGGAWGADATPSEPVESDGGEAYGAFE